MMSDSRGVEDEVGEPQAAPNARSTDTVREPQRRICAEE